MATRSATYRLWARGRDWRRSAEIDDFDRFGCVLRFNDVGTWSLSCAASSLTASDLVEGGGIILTRDNVPVMSGPVTSIRRSPQLFEASGTDDICLLADDPALPDPLGPPYPSDYDGRTGPASSVMQAFVDANIGLSARADRRVTHLVFAADAGLGGIVTGRGNFQTLLELLQEVALTENAGGLRFQITQKVVGADLTAFVEFSVTEPQDRSEVVVISDGMGTLGDYETKWDAPQSNYAILLGKPAAGTRLSAEYRNVESVNNYGRQIFKVFDARSVDNATELQQQLTAILAEGGEHRAATFVPIDTASLAWGRDYDLGDVITAVIAGVTYADTVREVEIGLANDQMDASVTVTVGSANARGDDTELGARQLRTVQRRVSNLERNFEASSVTGLPEVGDVRMTARASPAAGWLDCNGQDVSRSTYALLFGVIGVTFGAGSGSTFRVPDLRDRVPIGAGGSYALGATPGANAVDTSHGHTLGGHVHGLGGHVHGQGTYAGTGHAHGSSSLGINGATGAINGTTGLTINRNVTAGAGSEDYVDHLHGHLVGTLDVVGNTDSGGEAIAGNSGPPSTNSDGPTTNSGTGGPSALSVVQASTALRYEIYTGV